MLLYGRAKTLRGTFVTSPNRSYLLCAIVPAVLLDEMHEQRSAIGWLWWREDMSFAATVAVKTRKEAEEQGARWDMQAKGK